VIVSASPISIMDPTVFDRIRQLRLELAAYPTAGLGRFNRRWVEGDRQAISMLMFATLNTAATR
jgi:hypothetical protein